VTYYVPGLGEKDSDKTIRSLMQAHQKISDLSSATYVNSIDTKSGDFTLNSASGITASSTNDISLFPGSSSQFGAVKVDGTTITSSSGVISASFSKLTNSTTADVALNNTGTYFTGPTIAPSTSGTWFVSGTITVRDTAGAADFHAKLWDGTTVIASVAETSDAANRNVAIALSGYITAPSSSVRISCKDTTSTSGQIRFNATGESKDSTISAIRIG
jgi:hypothetical protein